MYDGKSIDLSDCKSYDLESFVDGELDDLIKLMLNNNNNYINIVCCIKLDNAPGVILPLCDWLYTKNEDCLWDTYNFEHSFWEDNVVFDFTNHRLVFINTDLDVTLDYIHVDLYVKLYLELCNPSDRYNDNDKVIMEKAFDFVCNRKYEGKIHFYLYENDNILWM